MRTAYQIGYLCGYMQKQAQNPDMTVILPVPTREVIDRIKSESGLNDGQVAQFIRENPEWVNKTRRAIMGAGLGAAAGTGLAGAGLGAGVGAIVAKKGKRLRGAGIGAGIGGLAGIAPYLLAASTGAGAGLGARLGFGKLPKNINIPASLSSRGPLEALAEPDLETAANSLQ